ncbi:glycosyltransferase family 2 protein [Halorarius halobius]|uniref:glycosyltransferase family 2 protein n=1 Tax=Halorarius halobius TaxID=2962671 RepID=UPI0020CED14D|nr:glycosyltransferase family 2 protein [Halorarius halobius]
MYNEQTVAVVVPAYNEEPFIGEVISTLPGVVDRAYVVDDGSTDGTWAAIQVAAARANAARSAGAPVDPPDAGGEPPPATTDGGSDDRVVVPVRHDENRGAGAAVKTGYRHALADGVDVVALIAGDGQTDPELVERLVTPVAAGRAEYAKGNRLGADDREPMPSVRLVGNLLLTGLTRVASGYWSMTDSQNGSTAIAREALERIDLEAVYDGYGWCNDLLVRLNTHDTRIVDVPHRAVYQEETSHITLSTYVPAVSLLLLRGFLRRLRRKYLRGAPHPVALGYLGGGALTVGGALAWLRNREGARLSVLGLLSFVVAMLADAVDNADLQEPSDRDQ